MSYHPHDPYGDSPVETTTMRAPFVVDDARLQLALTRDAHRHATVSEYAAGTGIDTASLLRFLEPRLQDQSLLLEFVGGEMFVHTAPLGRPAPSRVMQAGANLWEQLRSAATPEVAYGLWKLIRALETAGWAVETSAPKILFGLGRLTDRPFLGVMVKARCVPVLVFPTAGSLAQTGGILDEYEFAGSPAIAIACEEGALDATTTAVRQWMLARRIPPRINVIVLEAPRYNPTLLTAADAAVSAKAVSQSYLADTDWAH
jgi:hypothetical protein